MIAFVIFEAAAATKSQWGEELGSFMSNEERVSHTLEVSRDQEKLKG